MRTSSRWDATSKATVLLAAALAIGAAARAAPGDGAMTTTGTAAAAGAAASIDPASLFARASAAPADTPATGNCLPGHTAYLRARVRGASTLDVDWHGDQLQCEGDPRPGGRGIRLTFAGRVGRGAGPGSHHLRFVFGIDAPAHAGTAREVSANITLLFEGERRVYSTAGEGEGQCTVDSLREQALPGTAGPRLLRVTARGFCVGPASALEDAQAGATDGSGSGTRAPGPEDQLIVSRFDFEGALRVPMARRAGAGGTPQ